MASKFLFLAQALKKKKAHTKEEIALSRSQFIGGLVSKSLNTNKRKDFWGGVGAGVRYHINMAGRKSQLNILRTNFIKGNYFAHSVSNQLPSHCLNVNRGTKFRS